MSLNFSMRLKFLPITFKGQPSRKRLFQHFKRTGYQCSPVRLNSSYKIIQMESYFVSCNITPLSPRRISFLTGLIFRSENFCYLKPKIVTLFVKRNFNLFIENHNLVEKDLLNSPFHKLMAPKM